jgi:Domain of unknown function (DUF4156)
VRPRSLIAPLLAAALAACADQLPDHVVLQPAGEEVEIVAEPPSKNAYEMVGEIVGAAEANDLDIAQQAARNDLRNHAAALGASLVTIDDDRGEPVLLVGRTRVTLTGRAYKAID